MEYKVEDIEQVQIVEMSTGYTYVRRGENYWTKIYEEDLQIDKSIELEQAYQKSYLEHIGH